MHDQVIWLGKLLGLQVLFLRIDARPGNLARHDTVADARHLRLEGSIIFIISVDAQDIAACQVAALDVFLLQFTDVHPFCAPLDGFAEDIDTVVLTVHHQFHHRGARPPVSHLAPELEGQRVAQHRHIIIGCQQHPFAVGWHPQQGDIQFLARFVAGLKGIFLLVETQ